MHFTLADLITDITQNACESGATLVELEIYEGGNEFRFLVRDNGKGMTKEELARAVDPFVTDGVKHPHRKVGLGLPFLIQTAEQSSGGWDVQSEAGEGGGSSTSGSSAANGSSASGSSAASGTTVTAWFSMGNVDTPPEGDLPGMFRTILMFEGPQDVVIRRRRDGDKPLEYELRKSELVEAVGDFEDARALVLLGEFLRSQEEE